MAKHVQTHILEKVIGALMVLFGAAALYIFFAALRDSSMSHDLAVIQILLIIVLAILAQTIVLIRVYERQDR